MNINQVPTLVLSLLLIGVVIVFGQIFLAQGEDVVVDIQDINESDSGTWTHAYNASQETQESIADIPGWLPIVVVAVMFAIVIGLLLSMFYLRGKRGGAY